VLSKSRPAYSMDTCPDKPLSATPLGEPNAP
jgi:hypothetical protein